MSLGITKACFPSAKKCHNCSRKAREEITEKRKDFLRCSGCHLMTYCDKDCQKEHWQKVHKQHCKFLNGSKPVENSGHKEESCGLCIGEKIACVDELTNRKSPKTDCHIEGVIWGMKNRLGNVFGFHGEGKSCKCSLDFSCELPFPLGEVSGQYVGKGIDGMLAHAIKIVNAMVIKDSSERGRKNETLIQLFWNLIDFRSVLWRHILVNGVSISLSPSEIKKNLSDPVNKIKAIYGPSDAWCKALISTVDTIVNMNKAVISDFIDLSSIQGQMFINFKQNQDYHQSQLKNQVYVSENNLWSKFKLWPTLAGDSLKILLPDGSHCQTCNSSLNGEVTVTEDDGNLSLPTILPRFGGHGQLVVCCSIVNNPKCRNDCVTKHESMAQIDSLEEVETFLTTSRYCDFCLKKSLYSHRCSSCLASQYCSTQCQGKDLVFHKTVCATWAKDKFRKIIRSKQQKEIYKTMLDEQLKLRK